MKHLAQINSEFAKLALDPASTHTSQAEWWDNLSNEQQKAYLAEHPGSRMRPTPRHESDTPEKIDLVRKHVHEAIEKLRAHPGDAHADTYLDGPGDSRVDIRPGGSNFNRVYKKNDQLFEHVPRMRGNEKDIPINPDEAKSILRHHMGKNPIDPHREKEEYFVPVDQRPRKPGPNYNPRPPENYDPGPGSLAYSD